MHASADVIQLLRPVITPEPTPPSAATWRPADLERLLQIWLFHGQPAVLKLAAAGGGH